MRVLVACEFSQVVTKAFRERGHEAYSCDLLPTEGNPDWHIRCDVSELLSVDWDLMVAHPPCTDLAVAGAAYWRQKQLDGSQERAAMFFMSLYEAPIARVAVENPVGIMSKRFRRPDQYIEPYEFGEPYKKRTGLWLRSLPLLVPTNVVQPLCYWGQPQGMAYKHGSMRLSSVGGHRTPKMRSRTFLGVAEAMAEQWGGF